jgi:putative addiction module component (TIGR02574 family)
MQNAMKTLGIEKLPVADRLALISEIWDGLESESVNSILTKPQSDELARRVAEDDRFPEETDDADVVFSELEARLTKKS